MISSGVNLTDMAATRGTWLRGDGPKSDIVISSRVRLARNIAGFPFLNRCGDSQKRDLQELVLTGINGTDLSGQSNYVRLDEVSSLECQLLVERHLISRQLAESEGPRGVALANDESVAMMVNEEDHLRMQVLHSGLQLERAWKEITHLDDQLEQRLEFAFDDQFGYLTACPTNVGTGIRVAVMLPLPALRITGEIERVLRAAKDMNLAIRGLYGEGTEATGDFYQISNQMTLGRTEEEILGDFNGTVVPQIVEYELKARDTLRSQKLTMLEDRVWRAVGMLRCARLMTSQEALYLLSQLRMGVHMGMVPDITPDVVNDLFLACQSAHLQTCIGTRLEGDQRAKARADIIRKRLQAVSKSE